MAHFFPDRYNISLQIYDFFYIAKTEQFCCASAKNKNCLTTLANIITTQSFSLSISLEFFRN